MRGDAGEKNKDGLFHHLAKRFFVCAGISFAEADGLDRGINDWPVIRAKYLFLCHKVIDYRDEDLNDVNEDLVHHVNMPIGGHVQQQSWAFHVY